MYSKADEPSTAVLAAHKFPFFPSHTPRSPDVRPPETRHCCSADPGITEAVHPHIIAIEQVPHQQQLMPETQLAQWRPRTRVTARSRPAVGRGSSHPLASLDRHTSTIFAGFSMSAVSCFATGPSGPRRQSTGQVDRSGWRCGIFFIGHVSSCPDPSFAEAWAPGLSLRRSGAHPMASQSRGSAEPC